MTLPRLQNWETTRDALHRTALIINRLQRAIDPSAKPFSLHHSLVVTPTGLATHDLGVATLQVDVLAGVVRVQFPAGGGLTHALAGSNPSKLLAGLVTAFSGEGIAIDVATDDEQPFVLDSGLAAEYGGVLDAMFTIIARMRAHTMGYWSPLVLWAHHFDLSNIWFADASQHDEHTDAHINVGFSPGDAAIARPYFYIYGWSKATGYLSGGDVPAPAIWNPSGYTGIRIDYDALASRPDAMQAFSDTLMASYRLLASRFA